MFSPKNQKFLRNKNIFPPKLFSDGSCRLKIRVELERAQSFRAFDLSSGLGNGCGSVGRAVAYDTGDLRLKSKHRENCTIEKSKIKKKRPGMAHLLKILAQTSIDWIKLYLELLLKLPLIDLSSYEPLSFVLILSFDEFKIINQDLGSNHCPDSDILKKSSAGFLSLSKSSLPLKIWLLLLFNLLPQ